MSKEIKSDVICIGAGIMSATLAALLKEVEPDWKITVLEKLPTAAQESSHELNNAGTGHSALCELNYTVEQPDGSINIEKAVKVCEQFQVTRQFWTYLTAKGKLPEPSKFIMPLPHISLVEGKKNVKFMRKRFEAMSQNPLFQGMEFTEDPEVLMEWVPLIMTDRKSKDPIAATRMKNGSDVNFGALTRILFDQMAQDQINMQYDCLVKDLKRTSDGLWQVKVKNHKKHRTELHTARFVFIGAGGGSLPLLQKSGISEGKGIGGFPISGLFMVCKNPEIVKQHHAKVYSKAKVGAPPMSVPHLDTRYINEEQSLLFGPFAGFSPKFLKSGSMLDLIKSVKLHNIVNMCMAGLKEFGLVRYLVQQLMLSDKKRLKELQVFVPNAKLEDWELLVAGQRVQVIKQTKKGGRGTLQFGTEVVSARDGSIAALLGASPGASIAVPVMLDMMKKCFPNEFAGWEDQIKTMIPSYGISLQENPDLYQQVQSVTAKALGLETM